MKTAKTSASPGIFTTYDIGRMTGTDPTTVHRWIDKGLLQGFRTPGGHRRVRADDLRAFLANHRMPVPREIGGADCLRVLLAGRNPRSSLAMERVLQRLRPSWEIKAAKGCSDAVLNVALWPPAVFVFDLASCEVHCFGALCERMRQRPETAQIKVIAIGARQGASAEKRLLTAGASLYLKRPVTALQVATAIDQVTGGGELIAV